MTARVCAGDRGFDTSRVDVEVVVADVDENGAGAGLQDAVGRRGEGEGGDDDFVVGRAAGRRADAVGEEGEVEGGGAAVHGDGVPRADVLCERLLEGGDARALGSCPEGRASATARSSSSSISGWASLIMAGRSVEGRRIGDSIDEDSSLRSE